MFSQDGESPACDLQVPALTILAHPSVERVGERALLPGLRLGEAAALSRLEPLFGQPGSAARRPLEDRHLSRQPVSLVPDAEGRSIRLVAGELARVEAFAEALEVGPEALAAGVPLVLGGRVALLLHLLPSFQGGPADADGLVGESRAMAELRRAIARSAGLGISTLLRGETGTGKELVARAIHRASPRRGGPYLAVNLGGLPPALAAAELFGAARGAFTGADRRREGYFERAAGGTLFLDEIGEAPPEVQALLLRTLESGEIQPIGGEPPRRVDVRVIAATDAPLERLVAEGRFRAPLLHRLQGDQILLPPLRARRDDVGRLLVHFLRRELEAVGHPQVLAAPREGARPWLPARLVARLTAAEWPGNVRQLRNVARRLAAVAPEPVPADFEAASGSSSSASHPPATLAPPPASSPPPRPAPPRPPPPPAAVVPAPRRRLRAIGEIAEAEILDALRAGDFNLTVAADQLGVSRTVLDGWVERHPAVRKASRLEAGEIADALAAAGGDLDAAARELGVSRHGLRLRRSALGLP